MINTLTYSNLSREEQQTLDEYVKKLLKISLKALKAEDGFGDSGLEILTKAILTGGLSIVRTGINMAALAPEINISELKILLFLRKMQKKYKFNRIIWDSFPCYREFKEKNKSLYDEKRISEFPEEIPDLSLLNILHHF